ncbi:MAG: hypothetical protein A2136_04655 [Chloroflexi bacterium RBG_16_54_11]|nr:MAG: hypothetical protein A2136_04655 [Chloroflexi bacterium RBG_16_54_11]
MLIASPLTMAANGIGVGVGVGVDGKGVRVGSGEASFVSDVILAPGVSVVTWLLVRQAENINWVNRVIRRTNK